jgi:hypothetical protein
MVINNKRGEPTSLTYVLAAAIGVILIVGASVLILNTSNRVDNAITTFDLEASGVKFACQHATLGEADYCNTFRPVNSKTGSLKGYVTCQYLAEVKVVGLNLTDTKGFNCTKYPDYLTAAANQCNLLTNSHNAAGDKRWSESVNERGCTQDGFAVLELKQFVEDCAAVKGKPMQVTEDKPRACATPLLVGKSAYDKTLQSVVYCCP